MKTGCGSLRAVQRIGLATIGGAVLGIVILGISTTVAQKPGTAADKKKGIDVCGACRSSRKGPSTEEPFRRRSSSCGCGRETLSTTLCRVSWRKSGRHEKRPEFTARRGEAGNTWRALLDTHKWGGPPGHAGVVEVAGTAALADCYIPALVEAGIPGLALGERRAVIPQRPQLTSPAKLILV